MAIVIICGGKDQSLVTLVLLSIGGHWPFFLTLSSLDAGTLFIRGGGGAILKVDRTGEIVAVMRLHQPLVLRVVVCEVWMCLCVSVCDTMQLYYCCIIYLYFPICRLSTAYPGQVRHSNVPYPRSSSPDGMNDGGRGAY